MATATAATLTESPARWHAASLRAVNQDIQITQGPSGQWWASSGTRRNVRYMLDVQGNIAVKCGCPAGRNDDAVCKHRAAFYHHIGSTIEAPAFEAKPEAIDPQAALEVARLTYQPAETRPCPRCNGCGVVDNDYLMQYDPCPRCGGERRIAVVHQV
ncbi:MAG: hypothetical protein AB7R89_13865 [Dehalococcoidia bacterium]